MGVLIAPTSPSSAVKWGNSIIIPLSFVFYDFILIFAFQRNTLFPWQLCGDYDDFNDVNNDGREDWSIGIRHTWADDRARSQLPASGWNKLPFTVNGKLSSRRSSFNPFRPALAHGKTDREGGKRAKMYEFHLPGRSGNMYSASREFENSFTTQVQKLLQRQHAINISHF